MHQYTVVVGNVGTVYDGDKKLDACAVYAEYIAISETGAGRAGNEPVTVCEDGEILPGYEYIPENASEED